MIFVRIPLAGVILIAALAAQGAFVNFESAHVHPLDLSPDGSTLLAVNTPDNRVEVFSLTSGSPVHAGSIRVGLEPVTVRALDNQTAWVVNHVSDTITVVDFMQQTTLMTLYTADEPADVVFASVDGGVTLTKAYVSCTQANKIQVFDLTNLTATPVDLDIVAEEPRALAVSPSGDKVFAAVFQSGNNTTILPGGIGNSNVATNVVDDPSGPHGGVNPIPNGPGGTWVPPLHPTLDAASPQYAGAAPPRTSLIVRKDPGGAWLDDTGGDWSSFVTGPNAPNYGRNASWDLADHDLVVVDVATDGVSYVKGIMTACMGVAIRDFTGGYEVSVVGTQSTNHIRFEPNLNGSFVRVIGASVDPSTNQVSGAIDLNQGHINYLAANVPQSQRDLSIGDPRAIAWETGGLVGYVAGKGSNNVVKGDALGNRLGLVEVGTGPTGLVVDDARSRLYVLNHFSASITSVDLTNFTRVGDVRFHDPTPVEIRKGRRHLYDTHKTSGHGQAACASCHLDARRDGLAWDLGDPSGTLKTIHAPNFDGNIGSVLPTPPSNLNPAISPANRTNWHPMKGPMVTQTLQDIIGKEPLHWRGDRASLQEFNGAFKGLQGDDALLTAVEMEEYVAFLETLHFPPNPYRRVDDVLLPDVDLAALGLEAIDGSGNSTPLTTGDAANGLALFRPPSLIDGGTLACSRCHSLPTGTGTTMAWDPVALQFIPTTPGGFGEAHSTLDVTSLDVANQPALKVAQLRDAYEKTGYDITKALNTSGFGYLHDGSIDTLARFVSADIFVHSGNRNQSISDVVAFLLSWASPSLPDGNAQDRENPPGPASNDVHPGVGMQFTISAPVVAGSFEANVIANLFAIIHASPHIDLVAHQNLPGGGQKGYAYIGVHNFQGDQTGVILNVFPLMASAAPGQEVTFTAVPAGSHFRIGIDRDADGVFDGDEVFAGSDPADPLSTPAFPLATCNFNLPASPSGVTGVAGGPSSVTVSWTDASADEAGFLVERRLTNSPQWEEVSTVAANVTSVVDDGVTESSSYAYRVTAFNCKGRSAPSAISAAVATPSLANSVSVHVHAVEGQAIVVTGLGYVVYGSITVKDDEDRVVEGATVSGTWTRPGASIPLTTTSTAHHGQAVMVDVLGTPGTFGASGQTWTLSVTSITGTTLDGRSIVYDASADVQSMTSIFLP